MRRSRRLAFTLLAPVVAPLACTSWRASRTAPATVVRERRPSTVRVARVGGDTIRVSFPTVRGDSLVGASSESVGAERVAIAFADITAIETRELNTNRTLGLVTGVALAALAVYGALLLIVVYGDPS